MTPLVTKYNEPSHLADHEARLLDFFSVSYEPYPALNDPGEVSDANREAYLFGKIADYFIDGGGGGGGGGATGWSITGNAGTVDGTNFFGTTDNVPLTIKVNGTKSGRIDHINHNVTFGYKVATSLSSAKFVTLFGDEAGATLATSNGLTAFGYSALHSCTVGNNTAFGFEAGWPLQTGRDCTYLGYKSGYDEFTPTNISSDFNTFIGAWSFAGGNFNSLLLFSGKGTGANQIVFGGAHDTFYDLYCWFNQVRYVWNNSGSETDLFFRSATPEAAQAAPQGSLAFVNDGTFGSLFIKETGTGNTGWQQYIRAQSESMAAFPLLGSSIKAQAITGSLNNINGATNLTDQNLLFICVYVPKSTTITGVKWFQSLTGSYTANNYNGVGLYTYSAGTLTLVASSTNDGTIWATPGGWGSKAFSASYNALPGVYYVALLYCRSAETTAPRLGRGDNLNDAAVSAFDFTNNAKMIGGVSGITALPASQAMSGVTSTTTTFYVALY